MPYSKLLPLKKALKAKKPIKKPPTKQVLIKRLSKELDELCKQIVHLHWKNKCAWPGCEVAQPPKQLYCHHYFHKVQGNRARWEPKNGILLCYGHHLGQVHRAGNVEPLRDVMIQRLGIDGFNNLRLRCQQTWKPTIDELEELRYLLRGAVQDMRMRGAL